MTTVDVFGEYVKSRLDRWGDEFALRKDCDYLGHQSKNMLQVLIEHKGEMPQRPTGFKPLEVDLQALTIEMIVSDIARDNVHVACALRGYYCGSGRRKIERFETALLLMESAGVRCKPNARGYMELIKLGEAEVRGALRMLAAA